MPTTINGVGTRYYGRKNVLVRPGICRQCQRQVNLVSYDTQLWFVVLFLPIIPLGRKRILDACPACRRHYVAELQKWETAKQLEISGALEKFRAFPTPEGAIEAHRQLLAFHQPDEAAQLQKVMCEKFPDNAKVHCYLGQALESYGQFAQAEPLFARALELRPDMPEARIGAALACLRKGRLDEARKLLNFLEQPGAGQLYSLSPLESLALASQRVGRHEEALELFSRLLAEIPAIAENVHFRKWVKTSESALKRTHSILPKVKFSVIRWLKNLNSASAGAPAAGIPARKVIPLVAVIVVLVLVVMAIANTSTRHHRTLYVANHFGPDLRLQLSGVGYIRLRHGLNEIHVPEGHYHAHFSGPLEEDVDFDLSATYWDRFWKKPAWVLNPGGTEIVGLERAVYSTTPRPATVVYHYGRSFESFGDITHPFEHLPESVTLDSRGNEKTLTALFLFPYKPLNACFTLQLQGRFTEAEDLAEWALSHDPTNKILLNAYLNICGVKKQTERALNFLHAGLNQRPVNIEWHRAYQQMKEVLAATPDALVIEYENLLQSDPTNAALVYLLGRVCDDPARQNQLFKQAHQADPQNPYPAYALAYDQISAGGWPEARPLLDQVVTARPDDPEFRQAWFQTRLALQQYDDTEEQLRSQLRLKPDDLFVARELCQLLAAQDKRSQAEDMIDQFATQRNLLTQEAAAYARESLHNELYYALGDFSALEASGRGSKNSELGAKATFYALIEQGRISEADKILRPAGNDEQGLLLGAALAWRLAGHAEEARVWQQSFLEDFRGPKPRKQLVVGLMEGKIVPTPELVDKVELPPAVKAVYLANLAVLHPEARNWLNPAARRVNVCREFPYHLVQRATADPFQASAQ